MLFLNYLKMTKQIILALSILSILCSCAEKNDVFIPKSNVFSSETEVTAVEYAVSNVLPLWKDLFTEEKTRTFEGKDQPTISDISVLGAAMTRGGLTS